MHLNTYGLKPIDFNTIGLDQQAGFTRRDFMMTSLAMGFALASNPVLAQAISTDTSGIKADEVKVPVADGEIAAYQAMPAKGKNFPVILVIQEIFGVHEHIKDMCVGLIHIVRNELYWVCYVFTDLSIGLREASDT